MVIEGPHYRHSPGSKRAGWHSVNMPGTCAEIGVSSFNSLLVKKSKEASSKSLGNKSGLIDMFNMEYPPCLGSLFKGEVESAVKTAH